MAYAEVRGSERDAQPGQGARQISVLALLVYAVSELVVLLQRLQTRMEKRCRVQKSGRRPSLRELLLDPDQGCFLAEQQLQEEIDLRAA